jgi:uncharacterized protein (DUF305 family)
MTTVDDRTTDATDLAAEAPRRRALTAVLVVVMALALLAAGGGLAVALGIGRTDTPAADSVDAGFAWDMSRHHLQAVEMANAALDRSRDPAIRSLAFDIAATQTNQVGRMQGWLTLWGLPPTSPNEPMAWMGTTGSHDMAGMDMGSASDGALMPGMATEAELAQLRTLSGTAFDVQFLRLMIRHHQGGKDMAVYAAAHAALAPVRTLARSIADTQTAEVQTMTDMLTARGGTPLPAP